MDGTGMNIGSCIQKELLTATNQSHSIEFGWPLIPGLPDDLAKHCFALVARVHFQSLGSVCKSWRKFIQSKEFSIVRRHAGTMEEWLYVLTADSNGIGFQWQVLNPLCGQWQNLPPMPGLAKAAFGIVSINGKLLVMAGLVEDDDGIARASADVYQYDSALNSREFAYDPVRLPLQQDPTQCLYNRNTLETIWETRQKAQNPFTRQWFDIKCVIPQIELRHEMKKYIELHSFPADHAELEVIPEYAIILDKGQMLQYLDACNRVSEMLTRQNPWITMWKKINLLRVCCEFHDENIKTFRSLDGYRYLEYLIWETYLQLLTDEEEDNIEEDVTNLCKEIVRAIDVIGLRSSDIVGENAMGFHVIMGLNSILEHVFFETDGYMKIETIVLRVGSVIFDALAADTFQVLGNTIYSEYLKRAGVIASLIKFNEWNATDISSEDLNHGAAILRRAWSKDPGLISCILGEDSNVLVNAVIICIGREMESWDIPGSWEGQARETEEQARYNSLALEKGVLLIKDILIHGGPLASTLRVWDLLEHLVRMFQRFSENGNVGYPKLRVHGQKGQKTFEDIHLRIAQLGLDISAAMFQRGGAQFDVEVLHKFLNS